MSPNRPSKKLRSRAAVTVAAGRAPIIPPMPEDARPAFELLTESCDQMGYQLWRALSDVLLWVGVPRGARENLFHARIVPSSTALDDDRTGESASLSAALVELRRVSLSPLLVQAPTLARACADVAMWAEGQGRKLTALGYAEAAARLDPEDPSSAFTAGRLCRRVGEQNRALLWYARSWRLARRARTEGKAGAEVAFANAHRGYGATLVELGKYAEAEAHFWKGVRAALRAGRRSLAGAGFHDLLVAAVHLERWDDATRYAVKAASLYKTGHPRLPLLAFDIAYTLARLGHFSSALPILERVLPFTAYQRERILVLATIAEAAGAVRDHVRFERAAIEVLRMADEDTEMSASSLYRVAEGARCFQDWGRAETFAKAALAAAQQPTNATVLRLATDLLEEIRARTPGIYDTVPPPEGVVDVITTRVLRKLAKQPAARPETGNIPPERYPTE